MFPQFSGTLFPFLLAYFCHFPFFMFLFIAPLKWSKPQKGFLLVTELRFGSLAIVNKRGVGFRWFQRAEFCPSTGDCWPQTQRFSSSLELVDFSHALVQRFPLANPLRRPRLGQSFCGKQFRLSAHHSGSEFRYQKDDTPSPQQEQYIYTISHSGCVWGGPPRGAVPSCFRLIAMCVERPAYIGLLF